ncbi:MAG: cytochrome c-type biogenesis protein CcmH, partial [Actinomycetota bacterium]|nr:cytochrome c-type biogenesis protein CcmH [Actinomycetota bacterium]
RVWVDEGRSDAFIRDQLVDTFGEDVDYTPSAEGVTALVWILPVVGGAVAVTGLGLVFRRWQRDADLEATDEDHALVEQAMADRG